MDDISGPDQTGERPPESEAHGDLSVSRLTKDAMGELTGLERRLPRTLALLLTRPGFLTDELRNGRGSAYVSPMRLYLASSAAYFATSLAYRTEGLNLGFVTITSINGSLPTVAPSLILIASVPLFALMLMGLFGRKEGDAAVLVGPLIVRLIRGSGTRSVGEFLVFALYFQSLLLVVTAVLDFMPLGEGLRGSAVVLFFVAYVGLAARRLWTSSTYVAVSRAVVSLILYVASLGVVAAAALWIQNNVLA